MELRKRQRSGPEPPRAVTRLSADFMNDGSAAEAAARLMSALLQGSSCIVLEAVSWGLGSSFNFIWWITTLVKAVRPETAVHYNHAPSPYQCFENRSLEAFMTQAANGFLRPGPPTPAACRRHTHMDNVRLKNALFPGRTFAEDWFINRTTAGPTDVLRNNLYHQVRQWWGRRKQEKIKLSEGGTSGGASVVWWDHIHLLPELLNSTTCLAPRRPSRTLYLYCPI